MGSVPNIVNMLKSSEAWIEEQRALGIAQDVIAKQQYNSLSKSIGKLKEGSFAQGATLLKAIRENEVIGWSEEENLQLGTMVDQKRMDAGSTDANVGTVARRAPQQCATFELYLDEERRNKLDDKNISDHMRINICKSVLTDAGIWVPSEGLKGRIANIVKHTGGNVHSSEDFKEL